MKRFVLIVALILVSLSAYSKEKLTKQQKKEAKEAKLIQELDSILVNSCFDFYATMYERTYKGTRKGVTSGGIEFYPKYCDIHLIGFNQEKANPIGYAVVATNDGWVATFRLFGIGIDGSKLYDGVNQVFNFVLTVDKKANAVLRATTEFNDHKHPIIFKGKITNNTKN